MTVSKNYVSVWLTGVILCSMLYLSTMLTTLSLSKGSEAVEMQFFGRFSLFNERVLMLPGNSNLQISSLAEELARKSDDASRQQEEITHLLSQIVDLQKKAKLV